MALAGGWTWTRSQVWATHRTMICSLLDEALAKLAQEDNASAEVVKLRYFAGLTIPQVAELLGISPRTADRRWAYARAWLHQELSGE